MSETVLTREQWNGVCAVIRAYWPQSELDDVTIDAWYPSVAGIPEQIVLEAVYAIGKSGAEWPPTGGAIALAAKSLKSFKRWHGHQVMERFHRRQLERRTGGELGEQIVERVKAKQLEQGEEA